MHLVWRMIRELLRDKKKAVVTRFLIAAAIAATPYAFSFLGKWLVDEALQVTGPPKPKAAAETIAAPASPSPSLGIEWKAKTTEHKLRLVGIFLAASLGIHIVVTGLSAVSERLNSRTVQQMVHELRSAVHEKLTRLEMGLFGREQIGQLMTRVMDDAGGIPGNLTNLVINSCTQVAMLALGLVLLLRLNVQMTLIALVSLPLYAVSCIIFLPRLRRNAEQLRTRGAELNGLVVERLSSIATIKNYAQEDAELERFSKMLARNQGLSRTQHRLSLYFGTLTTLITGFGTLAVLAFGFLNIKAGRMQLGEVLAFHQVTAQLFVPISALVGMATVAQTLQVFGQRMYGILDLSGGIKEAPDPVVLPVIGGHVGFEGVSLRYTEGGPFAVEDVSLSVPAGKTGCIVGPTGCGKSTLLTLLSRFYDPTDGVVCIDGVDIRRLRLHDLRLAVGNIFYDSTVFSGTFTQNIRYGAPQATSQDIEAAARLVELHDFIQGQPQGYGAKLGSGGISLDAEQLVRLAVARALVNQPAILTIDDTFSTIDEEVETCLRASLRQALGGRTVIIATSRLSICEDADLVVVMRRGKIAQVGTHAGLLSAPGTYRRMYMRQMGMDDLKDDT